MAQCFKPFTKENIPLPCGKCENCRKRRASGWSFRLLQEAKRAESAYFITLTYENPPISKNGFMTLCKNDVVKFIRKLRKLHYTLDYTEIYTKGRYAREYKRIYKPGIKYYAVGEYGTKTKRPHYHIIIYNAEIDKIIEAVYKRAILEGLIKFNGKDLLHLIPWSDNGKSKGTCTIGILEPASCAYTLKYISKESKIPMHKNDDRQKEFSLMSKKLGDNYLNERNKKLHNDDILRQYIILEGGQKIALPRYYKDRLYDHLERQFVQEIYSKEILKKHLRLSPRELYQKTQKRVVDQHRKLPKTFDDNEVL